MNEVKNIAAQGDVLFRRVTCLPSGAVRQEQDGAIIVAHSETGHHHVIENDEVSLFESADHRSFFLAIEAEFGDVVHQRPYDTHATLRLSKGYWEIRKQREWDWKYSQPLLVLD